MKQIRVQISGESYNQLKKEAKAYRMNLNAYAGLRLSGFRITKEEIKN